MFELEQEPTLEVCRSFRFVGLACLLFTKVTVGYDVHVGNVPCDKRKKEVYRILVWMQLRRQRSRVVRMPDLKSGVLLSS